MNYARTLSLLTGLVLLIGAPPGAGGQPRPTVPPPSTEPQLVLLDTDIGDDIDDAFALALALQSPELRLVGVTTVFGDTDLRAKLVGRYLESVEKSDIPVVPGVPTAHDNVFTQAAYARSNPPYWGPSCCPAGSFFYSSELISTKDMVKKERLAEQQKQHDAAGFLLDQIRAHPGQITLIAIGPLINIQAAIERDTETFRKLKRVVLMGGSIYRGYGDANKPDAEWNIARDPAGARALLATGVPVFMMPLDSTQIHLEIREREAIFSHGSPLTDQLTLLYHQWLAGTEGDAAAPTLFDPVAVAYTIRPDLCPATPMRLEVDDKGFTRPTEGAPNAQVCLHSNEKGFLELSLKRIVKD